MHDITAKKPSPPGQEESSGGLELTSYQDLVSLLYSIFVRHGTAERVARILAENCAGAERDGARSHGIFRMAGYVATIKSGWVDPRAEPVIEDAGPAFLRVDARNGFTQPALEMARPALLEKARACGIACVAIRDSHHFGALWADVEPLAREGLVALAAVNSKSRVAPAEGGKPVFGTNPMAFAFPSAERDPVVFDQASSFMAHGDLVLASLAGSKVPPGAGVDRSGAPTDDPKAILDGGALLPFGGYKGASIAMMVEILGAAVTGGNFSFEVDWSGHPGAQTPKTGQFLLVIDPERGGKGGFEARTARFIGQLMESGQQRLPGSRRYAQRRQSLASGIAIGRDDLAKLRALLDGSGGGSPR